MIKKRIIFLISILFSAVAVFSDDEDLLIDDLDKDIQAVTRDSSQSKSSDTASKQAKVSNSIKETEEELILDGGAEDLLGGTKAKTPDTLTKAAQSGTQIEKTNDQKKIEETVIEPVQKETATVKVVKENSSKIENPNSINFARNLKEYRSPKIAMLMSLILPGAGEVYAKNGVRAAIFGVLEAGIIGTGVAYAVKGGREIDDAHEFADQHYKVEAFRAYYSKLTRKFPKADSIISTYTSEKPGSFSRSTDSYYDDIGDQSGPYVHGWDDAAPKIDDNFQLLDSMYRRVAPDSIIDSAFYFYKGTDSTGEVYGKAFGFSENQKKYVDKVSKGNQSYKISKNVFTLLLINHIMSAIDAGICAKAYNDKMLGKQSLWQRISIEDVAVNSGSGIASGYAFQLRF